MAEVQRWVFDEDGPDEYTFPRNPDRRGGDTYWRYQARYNEVDILGASLPTIHADGFRGARRTIRFTAIPGDMMRKLEEFWLKLSVINNCRDHLYDTTKHFNCFIESFNPTLAPTTGNFPGSGEDTYDLEMTLIRMG